MPSLVPSEMGRPERQLRPLSTLFKQGRNAKDKSTRPQRSKLWLPGQQSYQVRSFHMASNSTKELFCRKVP